MKGEYRTKIKEHLQLAMTIATFFASILYSFAKIAGDSETNSQNILIKVGLFVVCYLTAYVIFEWVGVGLTEVALKWIDRFVLSGIAAFIFPILFIVLATQDGSVTVPTGYVLQFLFVLSTYLLLIFSILTPVSVILGKRDKESLIWPLSWLLNCPWTIVGFFVALLSVPSGITTNKDGAPEAFIINVKSFWWYSWLPKMKGVRAMALGNVVLLGTEILEKDLEHELVHVRQYAQEPLLHPFFYSIETLKKGYRDNKYEKEAYDLAGNMYREANY